MIVKKVPVCCIMGQTDCGKNKLLEYMGSYDDIKQQQQQNHGGRSAAFFSAKYIEERVALATAEGSVDGPLSFNLPGLLIVDISAVESESNMRLLALLSCDLAVLVIDIAVGVDHEIIKLVKLLKLFHKDFVLVLNKVDKLLGWKNCPNTPISRAVPLQRTEVQFELSSRINQVKTALMKEGVETFRILPTSTVSGEGVADLLLILYHCIQKTMVAHVTAGNLKRAVATLFANLK